MLKCLLPHLLRSYLSCHKAFYTAGKRATISETIGLGALFYFCLCHENRRAF